MEKSDLKSNEVNMHQPVVHLAKTACALLVPSISALTCVCHQLTLMLSCSCQSESMCAEI